jgi:hypothetical protein
LRCRPARIPARRGSSAARTAVDDPTHARPRLLYLAPRRRRSAGPHRVRGAAATRGWVIETIRDSDTFCRLLVHGPEDLLVDIALDSAPGRPATASILGPTFAPEELVGRKVVALFDRAAPRDFVDVFMSGWTALRHALTRSSRRPVIRTGPRDRRIGAGRHPSTRANRASFWCTTASTRTHLTIRTPNG